MPEILLPPPYQLTQTRHGPMLVNHNDLFMGQSFLRYGECCEAEIQTLLQFLSHPQALPGLVVEVGSNMGVHTVPLARALARRHRHLLAFEPQPVVFQQLCANLALNGLLNVTALPFACAERPGSLHFASPDYRAPGNFGGTSMAEAAPEAAGPDSVQTVLSYPLDLLVAPDLPVALIKIDVEGFERRVLEGARGILARSRPVLYVENDRPEQSPELIQFLLDQGYRLWWHITQAFQPSNFRREARNIYGDLCFLNMLCLHPSHKIALDGLPEIFDPASHPLQMLSRAGPSALQSPALAGTSCAATH